MTTKTIKNVDERTWRKMKSLSAEQNLPVARLLDKMVHDYSGSSREFWKSILEHDKILSDKEAKDMLETVKSLRKERGFR